ncbi:MAG TPA: hypothetical protein DCP02_07315, partial [Actinobacteria bacterium]|nr:hypothetical protein [Actinomycetota bacterium]
MSGLNQKLKNFARDGKSIKIGLAGLGQMGRGLLSQLNDLEGMEVCALADRDIANTEKTLKNLGISRENYILMRSSENSIKKTRKIAGIDLAVDIFTDK